MTSPAAALRGSQRPRLLLAPACRSSAGQEAVELAASAGLTLDPWQCYALDVGLGERRDGRWAAFEVGLVVPRQNGKGSVLEARELAGLFLFGEGLILHSAHEFKTAAEAFRRVLGLIQGTRDLERRVLRVRTSHGEEGIELRGGQRLRFVARSTGSGRGFSGDCVILDEAYNLDGRAVGALLPTLSARPNPQLWYASSAPMATSEVLHALRKRAIAGSSPSLAYLEWSASESADPLDVESWAASNPGLGIRIRPEHVALEADAMPQAEFRRERLGIPDVPDSAADLPIALDVWLELVDDESAPAGAVAFAVDVTPDYGWASIAVAGARPDGLRHVEVADHRAGHAWVVPRLREMIEAHAPASVALDPAGPAGALLEGAEAWGVPVLRVGGQKLAQACGAFQAHVHARRLRHRGQPMLGAAVAGARRRDVGDLWAYRRRDTTADISPLVAVTLASWAFGQDAAAPPAATPSFVSLADL